MKHSTQQLYASRLEAVIVYLAKHLDADPDMYRLADIACLSPFHFHRVWHAWMGETVADTVRRLRLHRASGELTRSAMALGKIASNAGYDSPAAFSRAFRQAFGLPPSSFRALHASGYPPDEEHTMQQVSIETIGPITLASVPHTGPYMEIGQAFDRLYVWARKQGIDADRERSFGVYYCSGEELPASELKSAAAMTLPAGHKAADGVETLTIPALRCATLEYIGPYAGLTQACGWLYGEWLPQHGHLPGNFPEFEEYTNDPRTTPPSELRTLIRIPLAN
ncbi:Bifunctional transcriptional activator/DNA repair enzyme AdaA [Andreprevotia sp. IGB-42]|uniref:AraC family transcriptional regulator n=1 Tax=Andreprevotia sp. IGB-42 TaxID=2497473 RepID=UPI001358E3BD|nr:AraC family transcriptional regulator [Andreprevotia sp. IGB-42]KAF0811832.1 Bifunctional transcriptional activator/DNA repair enzyme AdaA [Andreprevotia sp. IGB-42]